MEGIGTLIFLMGFFWILEKTTGYFQDIFLFPAINNTIRDITRDVVAHVHNIPLPIYQTLSMPEIISCIKRISYSVRSFVKVIFLLVLPTLVKLAIASVALAKLGAIGLILLPGCLLTFALLILGTQWYIRIRETSWHFTDKVTMRVNDSILNTKTIRPFYRYEMESVTGWLNQEAQLWYHTNTKLNLLHAAVMTLLGVVMMFILYQAVLQIQHQTLTVGDFILIKGQLLALFLPFASLCVEFRQLGEACVDIKKIAQFLELSPQPQPNQRIYSVKQSGLVLKNVTFGYPNQSLLLNDLTLNIEEGSKALITGNNGSGKSSLLSLMSGLNKPLQGEITLNGHPLEQYPSDQIKSLIHFIPQDFRLFNLTLRENLTYGLTSPPSDTKLYELLEIFEMSFDLDTLVGELGIRLSGGEKQRVALAHAFLLKPKFLLCDETLHSLNKEAEQRILSLLFKAIPTVVLVSHQSSTLEYADEIYKIQHGKAVLLPQPTRPLKKLVPETL